MSKDTFIKIVDIDPKDVRTLVIKIPGPLYHSCPKKGCVRGEICGHPLATIVTGPKEP